jgi:hypothetical protein
MMSEVPMVHSNLVSIEEERRREETWRQQTAEVTRTATQRYLQIAAVLGLDAKTTEAFVSVAMETTRQYQTGCMYANYEKRTGHPYPDEGRENEEAVWDANWSAALDWLRGATRS